MMKRYAIILSGGKGERFWPMSTSRRPKQFLRLVGGEPLLVSAVKRLAPWIPPERTFIVTRRDLVGATCRMLPSFPPSRVIGEPCGRDTAAAIALGAALVAREDPRAAFCVLTADHAIGEPGLFRRTLREAFTVAEMEDVLVTIGIKPAFPATGFGYIEAGAPFPHRGRRRFYAARRFVEKPDIGTAKTCFRKGSYYWNSGMFVWSVSAIRRAFERHRPALAELMRRLESAPSAVRMLAIAKILYPKLEKISIDYAVMEKADNVVMAPGAFSWDDVGAWPALENHCPRDAGSNVVVGKAEALDATGNILVSEDGLIAVLGVHDLVVVRTRHATLVCPRNRAQDVKKLVEFLRSKKHTGKWL
ncbi:MAG: mannose-1-phosphate guanylyltransferase [Lentisphaerae bacterium]|nr:mannose-1-phosphate guanylyltransferase [Lentisphaerota bacterium]